MAAAVQAVELLRSLSAEEFRSGERIARTLGCSRAAIWKRVEALRAMGVPVAAETGRGYRLEEPFELLDADRILAGLAGRHRRRLNALSVHLSVDSTNAELQRFAVQRRHAVAVFAERQTRGRGRRGRVWISPLARNIYLSLGWRFDAGVRELSALPLVLALAACEALADAGLRGHVIKWPNDILLGGRKLGGCLVELEGDARGPCVTVLGVGINVRMPSSTPAAAGIDQPWTDVASGLPQVSRNALSAALLSALVDHVERFEGRGFEPFLGRWADWDGLCGEPVVVRQPGGAVAGVAEGLSPRGGLLLATEDGVRELHAGEASLAGEGAVQAQGSAGHG